MESRLRLLKVNKIDMLDPIWMPMYMLYDLDYGTNGGGEDQRVINGQEREDIEFHE